jgi:hypothetical protein
VQGNDPSAFETALVGLLERSAPDDGAAAAAGQRTNPFSAQRQAREAAAARVRAGGSGGSSARQLIDETCARIEALMPQLANARRAIDSVQRAVGNIEAREGACRLAAPGLLSSNLASLATGTFALDCILMRSALCMSC